jgi:hypothetical protein
MILGLGTAVSRIPDADNFVVKGAGPMLPLEDPETVSAHIERCLGKKELE